MEVVSLVGGNFSSSRLVRLLSEWGNGVAGDVSQDPAERLSTWLSPVDAIRLHSILQTVQAQPRQPHSPLPAAAPELIDTLTLEWQRVRDEFLQALAAHPLLRPPVARGASRSTNARSAPIVDVPDEADKAYPPYRKAYLEWQREMDDKAVALRARVRQALSRISPQMRQLALLDAALEQTLGAQEHKPWSKLPVMLERRFAHWLQQHQSQRVALVTADDPTLWRQPGGWLYRFAQDLHEALVAEWQVRLQPSEGLLEALINALKAKA